METAAVTIKIKRWEPGYEGDHVLYEVSYKGAAVGHCPPFDKRSDVEAFLQGFKQGLSLGDLTWTIVDSEFPKVRPFDFGYAADARVACTDECSEVDIDNPWEGLVADCDTREDLHYGQTITVLCCPCCGSDVE